MQEKKLKNNVPRGGMPVTIRQGTTFFLVNYMHMQQYISILHSTVYNPKCILHPCGYPIGSELEIQGLSRFDVHNSKACAY
jgi:hypothetical protein